MSHIEVSDISIEEPIIDNTLVPEVSIDYIDVALVFAIIVFLTRFIKSLKS